MISDLIAARSQMAMSLGFHIVFAVIGIAMPVLMAAAEWKWLRTQDGVYLALAKRWSKGTAILFAVGAVSGTVLSFELGLLWPHFMEHAGPVVGPLLGSKGLHSLRKRSSLESTSTAGLVLRRARISSPG
jgi:cytochrome d ubiquinol oxidase subunit I